MKKILSFFFAICLLVSCFTVMPLKAEAATVQELQKKYPSGSYWNHYVSSTSNCGDQLWARGDESYGGSVSSNPCALHSEASPSHYVGKYDCNYFDGAIQCVGFARRLGYEAFGSRVTSWGTHTSRSQIKPGDVVKLTNGPYVDTIHGHTVFVTGVSGSIITVAEANAGGLCKIRWGSTYNLNSYSVFVYSAPHALTSSVEVSLSWDHYADKHRIGTDNAVLAGWVNMNIDNRAITECGIYLYDYKESLLKSKTEKPNHSGYTHFYLWYDVNGELGYTLSPGTPYKYKFMLVINGKTYYSPLYTFTTGGPHTHKYNSGSVTKQPTCTSTGTRTYTCTSCGSTKTEGIAKKAHNYNNIRYHYATCTSQGYTEYRCSCGHSYTGNYKNALGHSYANATCTSPKKCKTCGATSGSANGHNYASATCTSSKKCKTCGATSGSANGHNYAAATCISPKKCKTCGVTSGSANGHNYAKATCTSPKKCKSCGVTSGKATGHNYTKGKCSVCGKADPNAKIAKIKTQPKSVAVKSGKKATVTVKVTGGGLKYQWYYAKKGSSSYKKISGATKATYSVKMTSSVNGRKVYCVITDKYGNKVKTNVVTLSLKKTVKITTQPKSTTTTAGKTVKTTVKATGDGLKYQWYYLLKGSSGYKKSSIKKATHSVKMTSAQDGCKLYCVITDKYGNKVKTNVVTLSLKKTVKITTQPKSVAVAKNKTAKVTVKATGDGLKYTWYYANKGATKWKKSSVTKSTYSVKMTSSVNGRRAYCVIKDKYGNSVKSNVVTLSMVSPLKITTQPKDITTTAGKTVKLTVKASGDGLKFAWVAGPPNSEWFDVSNKYVVSSGNTSTFTFKAEAHQDGYVFVCVVKDKYGKKVQTKIVKLTVKSPVKITKQPSSVSVENGKTAKTTVKATGDGLKYTWYYANKGATKWKKSSVTSAAYSAKMTSSINGRRVYCVIKDKYGNSVKSSVVTLSVAKSKFEEIVGYWNSYEWVGANGEYEEWYEDCMDISADGIVTILYDGIYQEKLTLEYIGKTDFKYYYRLRSKSEIISVTYYVLGENLELKYDDGSYMMFER